MTRHFIFPNKFFKEEGLFYFMAMIFFKTWENLVSRTGLFSSVKLHKPYCSISKPALTEAIARHSSIGL